MQFAQSQLLTTLELFINYAQNPLKPYLYYTMTLLLFQLNGANLDALDNYGDRAT